MTGRGSDLPFSHEIVVSIAHEQNIICSKTLICRQLFAGHVVGFRPMKTKEKIYRMIIDLIRILTVGLEQACDGGSRNLFLKRFPCISLNSVLVLVHFLTFIACLSGQK